MNDPQQPAPESFEQLLVRAIGLFEAEGDRGVARLFAEHPHEAAELRCKLQRLLGIGLLSGPRRSRRRDPPGPASRARGGGD